MTNPFAQKTSAERQADPCVLVIFGATGDLTARKLVPAIYNLLREGLLPSQFALVGFARRDKTDEDFREEVKAAINEFSRVKPLEEGIWEKFRSQIFYHKSEFDQEEGYVSLGKKLAEIDGKLGTKGNRVYYLSVQPSYFGTVSKHLHSSGLVAKHDEESRFTRVIIEKPFGRDLASASELQKEITQYFHESQIYRIDHYLGKETVQNILVFRFANALFESLWNHEFIDHVQITVAEDIGIGTRGRFWEEAGMLRDIIQNHMMQLLTLIAMEPPVTLEADSIRDEKVKVLRAIRPYEKKQFDEWVVRGQYKEGFVGGAAVKGYRQEDNVALDSCIETYAALKVYIDNWRWHGVPFYLRGGKRLPKRATEIAITFKKAPCVLFQQAGTTEPNVLAFRIQPDEGTSLKMNCKVPGLGTVIQSVKMDFKYGTFFGTTPPEAYERLIFDCILGDSTLFAREDEVFYSWKFFTPILEHWAKQPPKDFPNYEAGTYGPASADALLAADGRKWRFL